MFGRSVWIAAAASAVLAVALAGVAASGQTEPARIVQAQPPAVDANVVKQGTAEVLCYAQWAAVFSGLAMVGVIWLGWSLRTLARNQVELARMLRQIQVARGE